MGPPYLAPGPRSPGTAPSPRWCHQYEPAPWRQLTGWNLQPRWPGRDTNNYLSILQRRSGRTGSIWFPRTFFSPQISLMVLFPLRLSDPSMTSSCTRLAVWIISEIMATALCPGSRSLHGTKVSDWLREVRWHMTESHFIWQFKKGAARPLAPCYACRVCMEHTERCVVFRFTRLGRCGCWAPAPSGPRSSGGWPCPCRQSNNRTETSALFWIQTAPERRSNEIDEASRIKKKKQNNKKRLLLISNSITLRWQIACWLKMTVTSHVHSLGWIRVPFWCHRINFLNLAGLTWRGPLALRHCGSSCGGTTVQWCPETAWRQRPQTLTVTQWAHVLMKSYFVLCKS